ncbi:hypothetical protein, partial [Acinetobacter baumannii]
PLTNLPLWWSKTINRCSRSWTKRFSLFSFRPKSASYSNRGATGHGGHH